MPKLQTLAQAYGSETAFTKALAKNKSWLADLYDEANYQYDTKLIGRDEVQTDLGKRVDVVVYDGEQADCVIECQDQSGVLDPIHASKIAYYMSSHSCDRGILLCDTAPNETKQFIREQNTYMPRDIAIISVRFLDKEPIFTALELPYDRKARRTAVNENAKEEYRKAITPYLDSLSKLSFVEPIAPSDGAAVIKLDPAAKKWDASKDRIAIIPQKTKITVEVPKRSDLNELFPDLNWFDHAGQYKDIVMKAHLPLDIDINEYATQIYNKLKAAD